MERDMSENAQKKLADALKTLFELLEEYAPSWYTQEHRDQAKAALADQDGVHLENLSLPRARS